MAEANAELRALWRTATRESIDDRGDATGVAALREIDGKHVAVALQPRDNSALLRLRSFLDDARGVVLLEALVKAHARLLEQRAPGAAPETESLTILTLASVIDEPEALLRALKPGH
ncbi:MAG: hypothetical protein JST54_03475 [Deltaproteobacteria bacterium]|nr:hypothetical protein [Deltaproteobacteria bacterium]